MYNRPLFPILMAAASLGAQQPAISNANLQTASAAGGLEQAVRSAIGKQTSAAWIGYTVAKIPGDDQSCRWDGDGRGCGLEGNRRGGVQASRSGPVQLEGPTHVAVLLRSEQGQIGKIRTFTIDCPIDAGGGLTLHWLTGVKPAESVAMLLRLAAAAEAATGERHGKSTVDSAVQALAMHAGPEAAAALDKLATGSPGQQVRKSAIFWLANSRGRPGFQTVARLSREDPSDKVREHAVFALTQSSEPEAIGAIVRVAKEDKVPHVRGQALFWLAQRATQQQAAGVIGEALDKDPETEVKKKAVFALTQMPNDEGVPMLIRVARSNPNAAVRKQAMFWLGQSKDTRALKFFEDVLTK